jgi:hypothetical protein
VNLGPLGPVPTVGDRMHQAYDETNGWFDVRTPYGRYARPWLATPFQRQTVESIRSLQRAVYNQARVIEALAQDRSHILDRRA